MSGWEPKVDQRFHWGPLMFKEIQSGGMEKGRMASHPPLTGTAPLSTFVTASSLFPQVAQKNSASLRNNWNEKPSGMAPWLYSQMCRCCRLFNNLLMTVINNVSGLETAGI